jgi:hypothetical protein
MNDEMHSSPLEQKNRKHPDQFAAAHPRLRFSLCDEYKFSVINNQLKLHDLFKSVKLNIL